MELPVPHPKVKKPSQDYPPVVTTQDSSKLPADHRIAGFTKSIERMTDLAKEIQNKVKELRAASQYEKNTAAAATGIVEEQQSENEYEEEEPDKNEYAWRYDNVEKPGASAGGKGAKDKKKHHPEPEETGLKLKEGTIITWAVGSTNTNQQILDTQIVDQYTIYGSNILKTVMRQMGPPKTKYGQLLLNQIINA